ncbi:zf-HC2 domain-containing protein [Streptomyces sp. Caat 7-52]|uniref:zf-HC2 domain-containing protein n=1 Tax=Streptomyces sp. Caat 7-52 TaxID=2949637 RepID=UPI0020359743|nr:zf-HC2 domain-containing protein [Streptomyces sp. Caat 7-52]
MTSTTDTAGHPDVEEISDLTEGLLPPGRSADIRRHLLTCEPCTDVHASLEELRGLLGSVSETERMPDDVADRLDAALAAEALFGGAAPGSADAHVAAVGPSGHERDDDGVRRVSRETSRPTDRPAGRPQASVGPRRTGREGGRRRRRAVLGAVLTAAVLGAGSLVLQMRGDHSSDTTAHGEPTPSAETFSGTSVESRVKDLLTAKKKAQRESEGPKHRSDIAPEQNTPPSTKHAGTLLQIEPAIPDCIRHAINNSGDALAAETGTYSGKSAYLVVVPDTGDSARITAYVIDATCIHQQPASSGKVLLKKSYPRS